MINAFFAMRQYDGLREQKESDKGGAGHAGDI
jgi:hypothetical protein